MMLKAGGMEDMTKEDKMTKMMDEAQMAYLLSMATAVTMTALNTFRYRGDAQSYYSTGDLSTDGATNYWKMSTQVRDYSFLVVGTVMTVTQLLSVLGMSAGLNMMVWGYGAIALTISGLISSGIGYYGYDNAYTQTTSNTSVMGSIKTDMLAASLEKTTMGFEMYLHMEGWVMAQMYQMCMGDFETCEIAEVVEAREMKEDMKHGDKKDHGDMDKMDHAKMFANYLGF